MSSRTYAVAMRVSHQRFGFKTPISRRLPQGGLFVWGLLVMFTWLSLAGFYVFQVTNAASRSDNLQTLEVKKEVLHRDVIALEDRATRSSSMEALAKRAKQLGFIEVKNPEFVNPAAHAFARK